MFTGGTFNLASVGETKSMLLSWHRDTRDNPHGLAGTMSFCHPHPSHLTGGRLCCKTKEAPHGVAPESVLEQIVQVPIGRVVIGKLDVVTHCVEAACVCPTGDPDTYRVDELGVLIKALKLFGLFRGSMIFQEYWPVILAFLLSCGI